MTQPTNRPPRCFPPGNPAPARASLKQGDWPDRLSSFIKNPWSLTYNPWSLTWTLKNGGWKTILSYWVSETSGGCLSLLFFASRVPSIFSKLVPPVSIVPSTKPNKCCHIVSSNCPQRHKKHVLVTFSKLGRWWLLPGKNVETIIWRPYNHQ